MFKNLSIKIKLALLIAFSLIGLALSISYIALNQATQTAIDYEMKKLSTVEVTKHSEINKYLNTLKELLISMSMNNSTHEAFLEFDEAYHKIKEESHLNIEDVKTALKADYEANYISNINYNVPRANKKRIVSEYLPKNDDAMVAQYIFITKNNAPVGKKNALTYNPKFDISYMKIHKKYHPSFNTYLTSFDLYDIFLIDEEGNIVYTDLKEKDFATNLSDGVYANTGLAKVYKKALNLDIGEIAFEDFEPYEPSYNQYSSFIATPIFIDGKKAGILAFQMPVDMITKIMQFDKMYQTAGLGKTGESYLVGEDYMMRSNSRFQKDIDNKLIQELGSTIGVLKIKTKSTQAALALDLTEKDNVGKWIINDYRGIKVLSVYHAVNVYDQAKWAIVAELDESEALLPVANLKQNLIIISLILLVLFTIISLSLTNKIIGRPLSKFQDDLLHFFEFLKGNEKSVKKLKVSSHDEIGMMASSINEGILIAKDNFEEREKEYWIRDGINDLNNKLITATDMKDLTHKAIDFVSTYLNAGAGVLFIYNEEKGTLQEYASYAYTKRNSLSNTYKLGEGVVGQVALQKSPIELNNHQNKDIVIQTATHTSIPLNTYTYPLIYQEHIFGVIEIAKNTSLHKKHIEFLNNSSEVIATAISTSIQNMKVEELLENTKKANLELKQNQEKLEIANANMEEQQQQLEIANANMEEQQQQLEEANANMEEQQQQLQISEQNLKIQNESLEHAKEELERKAMELEQSSKYKSEFLANMSHELRTPLNAIILLSQLLSKNKKENLNKDDIKKAKTIFNSGNELLRLINDILDLSKVESGKMEVIVDSFDSSEFLENIESLFENSASEKNLELKIVDNYKGIINSDSDRISQIIRNLISNALKFTKEGSITVEIAKTDNQDRPIKISVTDTGIGIPKDKQEQIFKAFTQVDGSTSREYGGTGLGLSISRELSHLLGGEISLTSTDGIGSTFTVTLPDLKEKINHKDKAVKKPPLQEKKVQKETKAETNKTIEVQDDRDILKDNYAMLVIDDDIPFSEIVYDNIKKHNHFGLIANTANDGIELIKRYKISAILLDLTLPDMNGIDLLKELKNNDSTKDIPVYIISSKDKDDNTLKIGALGYGQKPLLENDIDEVISELEKFIKDYKKTKKTVQTYQKLDDVDMEDLTVLIVDDDIKNIFVLDSALNEYNVNVVTAYNGKEAIQRLQENEDIDIVLMDIMMPVMNGYEAIETIREDEKLKNIPIIAVTAKAMREDKEKCMRIGADDFMSKPIDVDALMKLVKVWSDKKHR